MINDLLTLFGLTAGSRWSLFWGGIGSCLSEFAILGIVWHKLNCHAKGCYRIGLHHVEGTPYITCRKHHPVHPGSRPATAEEIALAHAAANQTAA
jgi:hypothetical protein